MNDVLKIFNLAPERDLYEILKHSTVEERLVLCKTNKFKAMCKMIDFDTFSKREGTSLQGLQQYGKTAFKTILDSFPDFSTGLRFIEAVKPGFIYTDEFRQYVQGFLTIKQRKNIDDGYRTTKFIVGDFKYITTKFQKGGPIRLEEWFVNGKLHRIGAPARIRYWPNGEKYSEEWFINNKYQDGASVIEYWQDGKKIRGEYWHKNNKHHRVEGPAKIMYQQNGKKSFEGWFINGKYHRKDGPALSWYDDQGKIVKEEWWKYNRRHRKGGPAVIRYQQGNIVNEESWINGRKIS